MSFTIPTAEDIRIIIREEVAILTSIFHQAQPKTSDDDEIGKGAEFAAKILGKAVPTIYSLCHQRKIPHSKRAGHLYFKKSELLAWIAEGKRKTVSEIQNQIN